MDRPLRRAEARIALECAVYGFVREYGAHGDSLGRRERVGCLAAAIVDAAVFHAVVRIPAQAIGLGFPRSGNIGSGPAE